MAQELLGSFCKESLQWGVRGAHVGGASVSSPACVPSGESSAFCGCDRGFAEWFFLCPPPSCFHRVGGGIFLEESDVPSPSARRQKEVGDLGFVLWARVRWCHYSLGRRAQASPWYFPHI